MHIEGLRPQGRLLQPSMRKKSTQEKKFGLNNTTLSPSPTNLSHTTNITLSRIKCGRYIFIKKSVRSFIEVRHYCWLCFRLYLYYVYACFMQQLFHTYFCGRDALAFFLGDTVCVFLILRQGEIWTRVTNLIFCYDNWHSKHDLWKHSNEIRTPATFGLISLGKVWTFLSSNYLLTSIS